jgi:hypothetical protein
MNGHIEKPISGEKLLAELERILAAGLPADERQ